MVRIWHTKIILGKAFSIALKKTKKEKKKTGKRERKNIRKAQGEEIALTEKERQF